MTENKRYVEICNELWHYIRDSETFAKYDLNEVCDLLNEQDSRIKYLERKLERERCATQKQHEKWSKQAEERIKELEQENECLKDALSERGVSDIKCYGKRIDTGLFDDGDKV